MDYSKLYYTLFNAITDALEQIEQRNFGTVRALLIAAQRKTEEMYIAEEE